MDIACVSTAQFASLHHRRGTSVFRNNERHGVWVPACAGTTLVATEMPPQTSAVMPGLVPGIHVVTTRQKRKTWMAGSSPAMTEELDNAPTNQLTFASI
jgi:hypothetical protein